MYYRLTDQHGYLSKMRAWLTDHSGSWQVYDAEDLDVGLRTSSSMGIAMAALIQSNQPPRWLMQVQPLMAAIQTFTIDGDVETAERQLNRLATAGFS